jgi:predicted NBD/HSP70 family sugar kinase
MRATEIAEAAQSGDRAATQCLEVYCERLARALANVVNLIDPHVIVLGGGLSKMKSLYVRIPALWKTYIFSEAESITTRLLPPLHGDSSGVRGAAWLWPA